ncbi:hypothetical protein AVEN_270955-1, partial [Araneus ventricosus]
HVLIQLTCCCAILMLKSNAYFARESEEDAGNVQLDVTWYGQLFDSIGDIYVDNEQNRYKATKRTWVKYLPESEV